MPNELALTILDIIPIDDVTERAVRTSNANRLILSRNGGCYLRLSFDIPPHEAKRGFVFGNSPSCDIILNSSSVAPRHFSITLNESSGIPMIQYEVTERVVAGCIMLGRRRPRRVIEHGMALRCGDLHFVACSPNRGAYQQAYSDNLGNYVGFLLGFNHAAVTNIHAKRIKNRRHIGKYLELKRLGSGGFGEVCVFLDGDSGDIFAGKRFKSAGNITAIENEIGTLRKLKHNNIVKFIDAVYEKEGPLCLMMEYLPQGSLIEHCLTKIQAMEAIRQCLDGLAYIHSHNFMHRDIKPDNIVVKSLMPLRVNLVDFGLAREGPIAVSRAGTVLYMAPEVWDGERYTCAVDIWGLGLTALAILGKLPMRDPDFARCATRSNLLPFMRVVRGCYHTANTNWDLIKFLDHMLDTNPLTRWSSVECLSTIRAVQGAISEETRHEEEEEGEGEEGPRSDRDSDEQGPYFLTQGDADGQQYTTSNGDYLPAGAGSTVDKSSDSEDTTELPWIPPELISLDRHGESDQLRHADSSAEKAFVTQLLNVPGMGIEDEELLKSHTDSMHSGEEYTENHEQLLLPPDSCFSSKHETPGVTGHSGSSGQVPDIIPNSSAERSREVEELLDRAGVKHCFVQKARDNEGVEIPDEICPYKSGAQELAITLDSSARRPQETQKLPGKVRIDSDFGRKSRDYGGDNVNLKVNLHLELDPAFKRASRNMQDRRAAHDSDGYTNASYWAGFRVGAFGALFGITSLALGVVAGMSIKRFR